MQKIKQIAAEIFKGKSYIYAAVCSCLILFAQIIYNFCSPSILRLVTLIVIIVGAFVTINLYRVKYLLSGMKTLMPELSDVNSFKEGIGLSVYYMLFPLAAIFVIALEFVFSALIKTDWLYFIVIAVFTSFLFAMLFFTFTAAAEFEYIASNFKYKKLFAFNDFGKKYSSYKLARFTAVHIIQFVLFLSVLKIAALCNYLPVEFFVIYCVSLAVLYFSSVLEQYKLSVYQHDNTL